MERPHTNADFQDLSWHDCHIWGIELRAGEPAENDWTSELVLRLDFIARWLCGTDGRASFQVAPATLVFHDVTVLRMAIDWSGAGPGVPAHSVGIDRIDRATQTLLAEPVACARQHLSLRQRKALLGA